MYHPLKEAFSRRGWVFFAFAFAADEDSAAAEFAISFGYLMCMAEMTSVWGGGAAVRVDIVADWPILVLGNGAAEA